MPVIAPEGFLEHAIAENVYAGTAMARRAGYMYGAALERGPAGQVGCGLGQNLSTGSIGLILPTAEVTSTGQRMVIDGVDFEFQLAPGTEAPAEMHIYLPQLRALCMAENATHTLHNLLTLRGALVRDPRVWAHYLTEAIGTYVTDAEVMFAPHHWPTWGRERILEHLSLQRDLYAYLHDQTLRMINQGMVGEEIAEQFQMPPALENAWHTHGYYGSISHNVKAIYQRYMGWFDGNPSRLWPHPPAEQADRYVAALGGINRVVALAQEAYDNGDYRWAATLLDHAVFTDSTHTATRSLYAATLTQLAYGAENATWRNFFLSGATELSGENFGTPTTVDAPDLIGRMSPEQVFDLIAISVNGPRIWDHSVVLDVTFTDVGRIYRLTLRNGVLVHRGRVQSDPTPDAVVSTTKLRLLAALRGDRSSPGLDVTGDAQAVSRLLSALDAPNPAFDIVLP